MSARPLILTMLTTVLLTLTGAAVAQQVAIPVTPQLRIIIEPNHVLRNGAYVQGQVLLRILLVSPHPFSAINFAMPEIAGARVITLFAPKTRTIHLYDKIGYAYDTRLALFPEQSGTLIIPEITITGEVANEVGEREPFDLSNPTVEIPVHPINPPGGWWRTRSRSAKIGPRNPNNSASVTRSVDTSLWSRMASASSSCRISSNMPIRVMPW